MKALLIILGSIVLFEMVSADATTPAQSGERVPAQTPPLPPSGSRVVSAPWTQPPEAPYTPAPTQAGYGGGGGGFEPSPYYGGGGGSSWVMNATNRFVDWVDSIEVEGPRHITGVVRASDL